MAGSSLGLQRQIVVRLARRKEKPTPNGAGFEILGVVGGDARRPRTDPD
ncbi:MAG: hypothetical protein ACFB2Z_09295 [Maricaulaceae bacterium]